MKRFSLLIFLLIASSFAIAAPVPKALKKNKDADKVFGAWQDTNPGGQIWFFNADGTGGAGDPASPSCRAIIKIDANESPKQIDWSQDGGKEWYLGVYEFDGETLKMAFSSGKSATRPPRVEAEYAGQKAHTWIVGTRRPEANK